MNYTLDALIGFIARHDEHEGYYWEQLEALIQEREARAWDEGWSARASRGYAHLKVGECVPPPAHINPYRKAVQS